MLKPLVQNAAVLVASFGDQVTTVYVRVLGPGNVRLGSVKEKLEHSDFSDAAINDGMPQTQADGEKERFIAGDLYAITDTPGTFLLAWAPAFEYFQNRAIVNPNPGSSLV